MDPNTPKAQIIAAAMRLAAERPWNEVGLADIAASAGVDLAEMRRQAPSKASILAGFVRQIDDHVLAQAPRRTPDQTGRDAVFEVVMSRFDAMAPYKAALKSIAASMPCEPALIRQSLASQAWMLHAAGAAADGPKGTARVLGLASVYAATFRTWLDDDDPGLARTMAALDRRLRNGERSLATLDEVCAGARRVANIFTGVFRSSASPAAKPASDPPAAASPAPPA